MATFLSNISLKLTPAMYQTMLYILYFVVVCVIVGFIIWKVREKNIYKWGVIISTRQPNGILKHDYSYHGGIKNNKLGERDFHIKHRKQFWKKIFLGDMPRFDIADGNNTLRFLKEGDGTDLQQYEEIFIEKKYVTDGEKEYEVKLLATPIPTRFKLAAKNHLLTTERLLDKNKLNAWTITIIAFIIMAVVQIAFLYFTRKR